MPIPPLSATSLLYDLHSHIVPAVDDGVRDGEEALQAIEQLIGLGYRGAVITPHIYPEVFDNTEEGLREHFAEFHFLVRQRFPDFRLELGAEYYLDDRLIAKIGDASFGLLTIGKERQWILVEFPRSHPPLNLHELFLTCRHRRLQPIIAHVERYDYVQKDLNLTKEWLHQGALLQMDLGTVAGQYGPAAEKAANALLKEQRYHFIGTDLHRPQQCERYYRPAWDFIKKNVSDFDEKRQHQLI